MPDISTTFGGLVFAGEKLLVTDHSLKGELQRWLSICICIPRVRFLHSTYCESAFTCLKLTIETLEQGVKYVQS